MKINVDSLKTYIFCPMAYLLRYRYHVYQPSVSSQLLYDQLLIRYSRAVVACMLAGRPKRAAMDGWAQRHAKVPQKFKNQELFILGGLFISALYDTQQQYEYFATAHPYKYKVGQHILEGTVDALRLKDQQVQIVSIGRRPTVNAAAAANDIVGVLNRGVFARGLQKELQTIGSVRSALVAIPDAQTFLVNDSRRIRERTEAYIKAILRGIEHNVYYPRYQSCSLCGYAPICDPKWCTAKAQRVPRKTAQAIHELLGGDDEESLWRRSLTETARELGS